MDRVTAKREKVIKLLNDFLDRNKDYAIEIYIKSTNTDFIIGRFLLPIDRNYDLNRERESIVLWNSGSNNIKIPHNEVVDCYEEKDENGSQSVYVIMKCGIMISFDCCGVRM